MTERSKPLSDIALQLICERAAELEAEVRSLQRLADEAALWRELHGSHTGSILDRLADRGSAERYREEAQTLAGSMAKEAPHD